MTKELEKGRSRTTHPVVEYKSRGKARMAFAAGVFVASMGSALSAADALAQSTRKPHVDQIAQVGRLVPGQYASPPMRELVETLSRTVEFAIGGDCGQLNRNQAAAEQALADLERIAGTLPPFVPGTMVPAGARRDGVYQDGQARGHDGNLVRARIADLRQRLDAKKKGCTWQIDPDRFAAFQRNVFVVEPNIGFGVNWNSGKGHYASNGTQPPGSGKGSDGGSNICLGAEAYVNLPLGTPPPANGGPPVVFGDPMVGLGIGYCEFFAATMLLYELDRHFGGLVSLLMKTRNEIAFEIFFQAVLWVRMQSFAARQTAQLASRDALAQAPPPGGSANYWPVRLKLGIGPVFQSTRLQFTSNQVPGGGVFEAAETTKRTTGLSLVFGASTPVCRACVFGNPLMFNIEGRVKFMPSQDIALTSRTFGFTESARIDSRTTSSVLFKLSVPIGVGRY